MTTSKGRVYHYEAMFLVSQSAAADLGGIVEHLKGILARAGATLIALCKWDERRLAYEINKQKRGTYLLAYFSCDASKVAQIERDCNLSEQILRTLILRCDHLTIEEMRAADGQRALADEAALRRARADEQEQEPTEEPAEAEAEA